MHTKQNNIIKYASLLEIAMSNNRSNLKRERVNSSVTDPSTAEYDDWAKKFVNRPIPQIGVTAVQLGAQALADGVPANEGYDIDSAIGRFSWETVAPEKHIPALYRNGQQFCSIRMLEGSVLSELLQVTPQEIYDSAKLSSYFITNAEAKLLTYINSWHCDNQYGPRNFTSQDLIVTLEESRKLYEYIQFAYEVLSSGGKNKDSDFSKCGFVRVNNDSLIPYTVLQDDEKCVPLFYFEGQTDILKKKAEPLSGWELSYLKICCKVQGVRKDLIAGDSLQIVKLTDLRNYFPKRSTFEENCWPPPKPKSLLPKQHSISSNSSIGGFYNNKLSITSHMNGRIANKIVSNENFINRSTTTRTNNNVGGTSIINSSSNTSSSRTSSNSIITSSLPAAGVSQNSNGLVRTNGNIPTTITSISATNHNNNNNNSGRVTNYNHNNNNVTNGPSVIKATNGTTIQIAKNVPSGKKIDVSKLRVQNPPADLSRLTPMLELKSSDGTPIRAGAYDIGMLILETNILVHCINSIPYKSDGYLIVLQEFMNHYFPNVSIYPTAVSVFKSIGITTYLPNSLQLQTFCKFGFQITRAWEIPLVSATETIGMMPRLKSLLTPKPHPTRTNNNSIPNHNLGEK